MEAPTTSDGAQPNMDELAQQAALWNAQFLRRRRALGPFSSGTAFPMIQIQYSWSVPRKMKDVNAPEDIVCPVPSYKIRAPADLHTLTATGESAVPKKCSLCSKVCVNHYIDCSLCSMRFHQVCLKLPAETIRRMLMYDWACNSCSKCRVCHQTTQERSLLLCDACDRGYHTFCLNPPLPRAPTGGWQCPDCRECIKCGSRTAKQWRSNFVMCDFCFQAEATHGRCCICKETWERGVGEPLRQCDSCDTRIHEACDTEPGSERLPYDCPPCRRARAYKEQRAFAEVSEAFVTPSLHRGPNTAMVSPSPLKRARQ